MNTWLPQVSYASGNSSDISYLKCKRSAGSQGSTFTVCIHMEYQDGSREVLPVFPTEGFGPPRGA